MPGEGGATPLSNDEELSMRFTIERIRMLVVAAAVLLAGARWDFSGGGEVEEQISRRDLPQRLAKKIQQEANGFSFTSCVSARTCNTRFMPRKRCSFATIA